MPNPNETLERYPNETLERYAHDVRAALFRCGVTPAGWMRLSLRMRARFAQHCRDHHVLDHQLSDAEVRRVFTAIDSGVLADQLERDGLRDRLNSTLRRKLLARGYSQAEINGHA